MKHPFDIMMRDPDQIWHHHFPIKLKEKEPLASTKCGFSHNPCMTWVSHKRVDFLLSITIKKIYFLTVGDMSINQANREFSFFLNFFLTIFNLGAFQTKQFSFQGIRTKISSTSSLNPEKQELWRTDRIVKYYQNLKDLAWHLLILCERWSTLKGNVSEVKGVEYSVFFILHRECSALHEFYILLRKIILSDKVVRDISNHG